jgi:hypothetical protein
MDAYDAPDRVTETALERTSWGWQIPRSNPIANSPIRCPTRCSRRWLFATITRIRRAGTAERSAERL